MIFELSGIDNKNKIQKCMDYIEESDDKIFDHIHKNIIKQHLLIIMKYIRIRNIDSITMTMKYNMDLEWSCYSKHYSEKVVFITDLSEYMNFINKIKIVL